MPNTPISTWGMGRLDPFMEPEEASCIAVTLKSSNTFAKGTVLGELTANPGLFGAYATGNTDGTEVPKGILRYDCVVDAQGFITLGSGAGARGEYDEKTHSVDAFYSGIFKTTDLVGLDAGAVTKLGAVLISGSLANGIIKIPGV